MSIIRMYPLEGGSITSAPGFQASGVSAGVKAGGDPDVALLYSEQPCTCAAVFTRNAFKAAPVQYDQRVLKESRATLHAVLVNSGCANACTGQQGLRDAETTARVVAQKLGLRPESVMVMSTGVIGVPLPMEKIIAGVDAAVAQRSSSPEGGHAAARAIMTTDTRPKERAYRVTTDSESYVVAGMAKGAGMIHPNMATLLSVIVTDASIAPGLAQEALNKAVGQSFNMITVDGDTSTNDTLLLMANGLAEMETIVSSGSQRHLDFRQALTHVATELAKDIVRDGEGATRFVEVAARGAKTRDDAKQVAMTVARSLLVKTAIYGQDTNWGRIVCAVGYSGVSIDPARVGVFLGQLELVRDGAPYDVDEERASDILGQPELTITIDLGLGDAQATVWTCDISHEYIDSNAHYRT